MISLSAARPGRWVRREFSEFSRIESSMGVFPKLALALGRARSGSTIPALANVPIATAVRAASPLGVWRSGVSDAIDRQTAIDDQLGAG